jgi:hypothetical protein
MNVKITFISSSIPTVFEHAKDVYTKDSLLCLSFTNSKNIIKFPLCNVFSIESTYEN